MTSGRHAKTPLGPVPEPPAVDPATMEAPRASAVKHRVQLKLPRDTHYLALVRRVVADLAELAGFRRHDIDKIELAVDEACSNAIVHPPDPSDSADDVIELDVSIDQPGRGGSGKRRKIEIVLSERGEPFAFESKGNFDLEDHLRRMEPGGLGIYIIKNFMDEVGYEHSPHHGNVLTMTKYLG